jgi:hypothetical protein
MEASKLSGSRPTEGQLAEPQLVPPSHVSFAKVQFPRLRLEAKFGNRDCRVEKLLELQQMKRALPKPAGPFVHPHQDL